MEQWQIDHTIQRGEQYPFDTSDNQHWSFKAARTILADLQDRGGIKHGFNDIDEDIRDEIVESLATYIVACHKLATKDN